MVSKVRVRGCASTAIALALFCLPNRAGAQAAPTVSADPQAQLPPTTLQEVVVTAEKRRTNLQTTPIAVTALSGATLTQDQVRDLKDIQALVPSFKMGDAQGIAQITIRGIGSSTFLPGYEGAVAVNENEVYVSRSIAQQAALFDVADIEVLRGPQGTLYGRNATAGAVNITTVRPTDTASGYVRQTFGNYGELRTEAAIGGPIADDKVLARIAVFRETHNGYGTNQVTGTGIDDKDDYGARGTLVLKPVDDLQATLIAELFNEDDHSGAFHYFGAAGLSGLPGALGAPPLFEIEGGYAPTNVRNIANGIDPEFKLRTEALTGIIDWGSGPFSVKSISGYRDQSAEFTYEFDGGYPANVFEIAGEPARQFSEELQAHYDTDKLHLTGGIYYFHESDDIDPGRVILSTFDATFFFHAAFPAPGFVTGGNQAAALATNARAAFAQGTYRVTQKLSLTAGVRYSDETKDAVEQFGINFAFPPFPGPNPLPTPVDVPPATFHATTPKFGLQYALDPDTFLYATYEKGFKSGGFDIAVAHPAPFLPEKLTDYEVGLKTTQLDHRLRADLSGFYYDYTNLQVQQVVNLNVQTGNAATARVYGIEAELTYLPTAALELDATGAWIHARYGRYCGPDPALPSVVTPASCPLVDGVLPANEADFSGKALDNAPDYQASLAAQYTWDLPKGSFAARGEAEYSSRFYFSPGNELFLSQGAYVKGNLYGTYRSDSRWSVTAYVRNVGNTTTKTSALVASILAFNPVVGSLAPPRLYGVELQYTY
jgi:iron complex outermembrane recepter protein